MTTETTPAIIFINTLVRVIDMLEEFERTNTYTEENAPYIVSKGRFQRLIIIENNASREFEFAFKYSLSFWTNKYTFKHIYFTVTKPMRMEAIWWRKSLGKEYGDKINELLSKILAKDLVSIKLQALYKSTGELHA